MLDYLVVIPARYNSTRLPGKVLIKLNNKAVLQHVWEKCVNAVGHGNVLVAAGDKKIHNFFLNCRDYISDFLVCRAFSARH